MTKARDLGKLVSQGQPLADGTVQASEVSGLAVVATSGSYNDLLDKPTSTPGSFSGNYADLTNKPTFATVATSGSYADLTNKPTLFSGSYSDLTNKPTLFDGSYNTLTDKPTLFSGSYADLTNKPTLFSGSYTDLTNKPNFATVATSGSYADLTNKPTIISLKGTSITYPGDDLAADPAGGQTILVVGTGFEATPTVYVGGTIASSVSFVSSTQITFTAPPKSAGTYDVYIVNPGGATAIMVMAISYSGVPNWTTAPGSLGTVEGTVNVQLQATSNSAITYTLAGGSTLPSGITLSSSGLLSGTTNVEQTFSFTVVATDLENQDTSRSFQVTVSIADPYFSYNTLLLTGNGTNNYGLGINGAQNNIFVANSFAWARVGNVTQGTFTPYGPNWSNYFETGSSRLTAANNANWQFGTGDFTIEAFVFLDSTSGYGIFVKCSDDGSWNNGWTLNHSSGQLELWINNTAGPISGGSITTGTWNHVAATRNGTTVRLFVNGTVTATATNTTSIAPSNALTIAGENGTVNYPAKGYISNVRVNKGTALYTSNFVPATTPLTAVSGTVLLTCQDNRFVDRSSSATNFTVVGTPSVQRFSPFNLTAPYAPNAIGGSAYFDGNGDYFDIASSNLLTPTGDFTIEFWAYPLSNTGTREWYSKGAGIQIYSIGAAWGAALSASNTSSYYLNSANIGALVPYTWQHICLTRSGNNYVTFVNGVATSLVTSSQSPSTGTDPVRLGDYSQSAGYPVSGYMSDVRFVNGTAVYGINNFIPPSNPLLEVTNTQLLLKFDNAGIIDNTMMNNLETVGNAKISTSVSKFGGASMYFDGAGDRLFTVKKPTLDFLTKNFTIEFWVYPQNLNSQIWFVQCEPAVGRSGVAIGLLNSSQIWWLFGDGTNWAFERKTAFSWSINTWYHIAVTRNAGTAYYFINGVLVDSVANTTNLTQGEGTYVGGTTDGYHLDGYIDDVRVTNGVARYTANFTPPTAAHRLR